MKQAYGFAFLFLHITFCLQANCTALNTSDQSTRNEIVYEIFVLSFCDSNGDGKGDLPGVISKLDYIQDLGATAIWLMPITPSPSYHKYDVTDYYAIHPDFGTMEDMERLIKEVHKRKMKIIFDLVINHTSAEHPWFKASASSPDNPYRNYYVWRNFEEVKHEIEKKASTFDSDNLTQWHAWENDAQHYYGFFWKGMPDLNFDYLPLRQEIYKVGEFWIKKGVDGFRLDAAKHIFPDDRLDDTRAFWVEFTKQMRKVNPNLIIVGEVWSDPGTLASLSEGLPSLFNFELSRAITESVLNGDRQPLTSSYMRIDEAYKNAAFPLENATLLSNHDMNRIRSAVNGEIEKAKLAASILLSLPGTPYVYYGEEIGMLGIKPDIHLRESFPWTSKSFEDGSWQESVYSIASAVQPMEVQMKDPSSILNHYKLWIDLRKKYPVLANGSPQFDENADQGVLVYTFQDQKTKLQVIHNLNASALTVTLTDGAKTLLGFSYKVNGGKIELPGYASVILQVR